MARRTITSTPPPEGRIVDVSVDEEMRASFLEYAYSVIYSRALPDARDGLKPVQRRILYQMSEMGLRPERGHVKCARVVGEVMGKLHPHGDGAIYDALVRMAQPFTLRLPMVDPHGNVGSLDGGPAAMRYTECRLAAAADLLVGGLDEDVVAFTANYDGREQEPTVLPAAIPHLLVNGASGIAVGMATNIPPHNLGEVISAARHLLKHPNASLETLRKHVPGPDLPGGGQIVGLDGLDEAYNSGRGSFRVRAISTIEQIAPRRSAIVVTELPPTVGPERVIARIKEAVDAKKLTGVAFVTDLTDMEAGLRLVIDVKTGFNPQAVLEQLYALTPLEESYTVNAVALVDGRPQVLGLRDLLQVFLDHRLDVVVRRSQYRLMRASQRLHLVDGMLTVLLDLDEVVAVIRSSEDTAEARERLIGVFDLSVEQADYVLEMPLRRLTKLSQLELQIEAGELREKIRDLEVILGDSDKQRAVVADELAAIGEQHATPRRTVLRSEGGVTIEAIPLEITDDPCEVVITVTGLIGRRTADAAPAADRHKHDVVLARVRSTVRARVGLVTSAGRVIRLDVVELPALKPGDSGGTPLGALTDLAPGERVVGLTTLEPEATLVLATARGTVKRVMPVGPVTATDWSIIGLDDGDFIVGASVSSGAKGDRAALITSDAKVLHFDADKVRSQGRPAGGVTGIALSPGSSVVAFGVVGRTDDATVVTIATSSAALPGVGAQTVKVTPFGAYPGKGRATGGVRVHRFLRGEDRLELAYVGSAPAYACSANGTPIPLPPLDDRRDGSGLPPAAPITHLGSAHP